MLRSMTGFGKSAGVIGGKTFSVEARSLNSKYLDMNLKIPSVLKDKEIDFRNILSEKVMRGKTELAIDIDGGGTGSSVINRKAFKKYYAELESLAEELGAPSGNLFETVMRIPDVMSTSESALSDKEFTSLLKLISKAVENLDNFRQAEGKQIGNDMMKRIGKIKKSGADIKKTEGRRKEVFREKLRQKLAELSQSKEVDETRLEQELLLYAERLDITEELVRLESHCNYFMEVMNDKEISKGKKLSFITQEIGREANTLGSKASDAALQKLVVEIKEELEKIKEQGNNVL